MNEKIARPREELEREFMDRNQPHNEAHWWAINEIERLKAELNEIKIKFNRPPKDTFNNG